VQHKPQEPVGRRPDSSWIGFLPVRGWNDEGWPGLAVTALHVAQPAGEPFVEESAKTDVDLFARFGPMIDFGWLIPMTAVCAFALAVGGALAPVITWRGSLLAARGNQRYLAAVALMRPPSSAAG
jgi:hypothetical protein